MTYNHERHIEQCIRSVVAQDTDARLEVLVGVDRGDDSTLDMVRKMSALFPEVVRCLERGKNVGGYRNYQLTLEQASGNYIAYLDGDDFWLPGKLQAQLDFLAAHTDCPAVYANA
ncbi:MAG: glycosyltransferase family A protein, partial [Gammaproteobacteria bacterium]|nr:glycosyltransferase family A protein [Gammaproteobacteria bacterium]